MIFNPDKHKLGKICRHNHEFEETGQSVRFQSDGKCVVCKIERNKQRYQADPEKARGINRKYQKANPEKVREACRKWQKANPERVKLKTKEYYLANKEKIKETTQRWRQAHPDRARELAAKWQHSNPEKVSDLNKKWREANAEKLDVYRKKYYQANKERIKEANRKRRQAQAAAEKEFKARISAIAKMSCEELRKKNEKSILKRKASRKQWEADNRDHINEKQRQLYLKKNGGVIKTYAKKEPRTVDQDIADLKQEAAWFNQLLAEIRNEQQTMETETA